jgi:hypothetical protein
MFHAHAATRHVGDLGLGRETRGEDQVVALGVAQPIGRVLVHHTAFHRDGTQDIRVHAFTVIGNRQQDVIAFLLGRQDHLAATGLARGFAFFR